MIRELLSIDNDTITIDNLQVYIMTIIENHLLNVSYNIYIFSLPD